MRSRGTIAAALLCAGLMAAACSGGPTAVLDVETTPSSGAAPTGSALVPTSSTPPSTSYPEVRWRLREDPQVRATVETAPVPSSGDAADDPAIWVDPNHPERSVIIGTDKQSGLGVWDLSGKELQFVTGGTPNNVDLRDGFPLAGGRVPLVVAADDSDSTLWLYALNPRTRRLVDVAAREVHTRLHAHGICLYHDPASDRFYAFPNDSTGDVEQWELIPTDEGLVDAEIIRTWDVGGQVEGCAVDDELGRLYISEEERGVWRYEAAPNGSTVKRVLVDRASDGGHIAPDAEGIAIAYGADGTGFVFVSSQGDNSFTVYSRDDNAFLFKFEVAAGDSVDACTDTDGIDVTTRPMGPDFPHGVFVCQDVYNYTPGEEPDFKHPEKHQDFKLVPLERILVPA